MPSPKIGLRYLPKPLVGRRRGESGRWGRGRDVFSGQQVDGGACLHDFQGSSGG